MIMRGKSTFRGQRAGSAHRAPPSPPQRPKWQCHVAGCIPECPGGAGWPPRRAPARTGAFSSTLNRLDAILARHQPQHARTLHPPQQKRLPIFGAVSLAALLNVRVAPVGHRGANRPMRPPCGAAKSSHSRLILNQSPAQSHDGPGRPWGLDFRNLRQKSV